MPSYQVPASIALELGVLTSLAVILLTGRVNEKHSTEVDYEPLEGDEHVPVSSDPFVVDEKELVDGIPVKDDAFWIRVSSAQHLLYYFK